MRIPYFVYGLWAVLFGLLGLWTPFTCVTAIPQQVEIAKLDSQGDPLPLGALARLGTVRFRHGANIGAMAVFPDKQRLITGGGGVLRIWELSTGKETTAVRLPATKRASDSASPPTVANRVNALTISADGRFVAILADDQPFLWDMQKEKQPTVLRSPPAVNLQKERLDHSPMKFLAFAGKDNTLYALSTKKVVFTCAVDKERETGLTESPLKMEGRETDLSLLLYPLFGIGENVIVDGDKQGTIRLLDPVTGRVQQTIRCSSLSQVKISADQKHLVAVVRKDRNVGSQLVVWSLPDGKEIGSIPVQGSFPLRAVDAKAERVALDNRRDLEVWDIHQGKIISKIDPCGLYRFGMMFLPDGKQVAAPGFGGVACFWDVETGKQRDDAAGHSAAVSALAYTADGLLSGSRDGTIRLWNVERGREARRFEGHRAGVDSLLVSHDRKTVYSTQYVAGAIDTICVWDAKTGTKLHELTEKKASFYSLALSSDGKLLAAGGVDDSVYVWDLAAKKPRTILKADLTAIEDLTFTPDGSRLIGRDSAGPLVIWDLAKEAKPLTIEVKRQGRGGVLVSPDTKHIIAPMETDRKEPKIVLGYWDLDKGELKDKVEIGPGQSSAMVYGPDGKTILLGTEEGKVVVWDCEKKALQQTYAGHRGPVSAIAVAPDGKTFATGSEDSTILVWPAPKTR